MQKEFETKSPKVVVVSRNPKDCLVSYYHFYQNAFLGPFTGTFSEFLELYKNKRLVNGDIFDFYLSWWKYR